MDPSGVSTPEMDWTSADISEERTNFKQHVELICSGPLADEDEMFILTSIKDATFTSRGPISYRQVSMNITAVFDNTCNPR